MLVMQVGTMPPLPRSRLGAIPPQSVNDEWNLRHAQINGPSQTIRVSKAGLNNSCYLEEIHFLHTRKLGSEGPMQQWTTDTRLLGQPIADIYNSSADSTVCPIWQNACTLNNTA